MPTDRTVQPPLPIGYRISRVLGVRQSARSVGRKLRD